MLKHWTLEQGWGTCDPPERLIWPRQSFCYPIKKTKSRRNEAPWSAGT